VRLPTIEDAVKAGGFLAGRPEGIIEALKGDRETLSRPRPRQLRDPLGVQLADLERFAKEVIPAFRDTRTAAAQ
jgi:hypothetical protein